ncbi:MAG TPA: phosphatase PAP2 family protein [Beijerinckiaceae bacterium]|jgi:hypothetical protein|nr:phosphatase PAP2 family protein [Beijerinckiaceae bacterium]
MAYKPLVSLTRPSTAVFEDQLHLVHAYADLRPDRAAEILSQLSATTVFVGSIAYLHPDRTPKTLELIATAFRLANLVEMRLKHGLACRRPNEYSPQLQPMILTPAHGALPSGHATEAFIASTVLWRLLEASGHAVYSTAATCEQLMRLASRTAINRTVAGVHFPVDSVAGALLGLTLGHYLVSRCTGAADYEAWSFDGHSYPVSSSTAPAEDFNWRVLFDVGAAGGPAQVSNGSYIPNASTQTLDAGGHSPLLAFLWDKAAAEWA